MNSQRWIARFFGAFFVLYIFMGLWDQFSGMDDIYPFSDWYLYSYVDREGEGYDLKALNPEGDEVLLSEKLNYHDRKEFVHDLERAVRLGERGEESKMIEMVRDIGRRHSLKGKVTLVRREYERLEYYKESKWKNEYDVTSFEFQ